MSTKTRFIVAKTYKAGEVIFEEGKDGTFSIPVNGIPGLAEIGFVWLLNSQCSGGPRTLEYYKETAELLIAYLSTAWTPSDSPEVMRKRFQLSRAIWLGANEQRKASKSRPCSFASRVKLVAGLEDNKRNFLFSHSGHVNAEGRRDGGFADVIAGWNETKQVATPIDMSETVAGLMG